MTAAAHANGHLDVAALKQAAEGRWPELLCRLGGLPAELLDGRHHPCPKCGGRDRFRMIDRDRGAVMCNQCFAKQNGDGIAALMWATGEGFSETVSRVAAELGMGTERRQVDVLQEMAWRKGITVESLKAYGAAIAQRGELTVCRVPMFNARMERVGDFDLAPSPEDFAKGMMVKGSKHGLFIASKPTASSTVLLVEGVKDAAALHALGFLAVGLPTCTMAADFAPMFRDCRVIIVPDRDKAGTDGATQTAARLYGVAAVVYVVTLPAEYSETDGADVRDVLRMKEGEQKLRAAIADAQPWNGSGGEASKPFRIETISMGELDADGTEATFIIRDMLVENELGFNGSARKGMKTSTMMDMAVSIATKTAFLGFFEVLACRKVLYLSGEGSRPFLRKLVRRICESKGLHPADVTGLRLATTFPRLDVPEHLEAIRIACEETEAEVVFYDCVYLGLSGTDANNSLAMGEKLGAVISLCEGMSVTPLLLHHTTRRQQHEYAGQAPELVDLSWAGFAEAAAQWFMLGRREKYDPARPGSHRLVYEFGGRHGQSGAFAVDIEEGSLETGRYWQVDVHPVAEAREAAKDARQAARDAERDARRQEELDQDRENIVQRTVALGRETKNIIREGFPEGHRRFERAFASLVDDKTLRMVEVKKANGQTYGAWEVAPNDAE